MHLIKFSTSIASLALLFLTLNACTSETDKPEPAKAKQVSQNMQPNQTEELDMFFSETNAFLSDQIEDGKVPYETIQQDTAELNALVKMIGNVSLDNAEPAEKKAFYINAYNLITIKSIIQNDIPSSPMDVDGFFDTLKHDIAGKEMTLDEIEKGTLFPEFGDARVHFAVVCAAKGCPQIQSEAYMPEELDEQLDQAAQESLNRDYFIRVDEDEETVEISQLFDWYKDDFLKNFDSALAYINQYRDKKIPSDFTVDYYDYDWSLNSL